MSVSTGPGATAFTVTPLGPSSAAQIRVPLTLERSERRLVERDLPRLAALRRADHPTSDRASNEQPPPHEIHVLPAEREQVAVAPVGSRGIIGPR
jgi:hypothetical protein